MKRAGWLTMVFFSLGVCAYAIYAYGVLAPGTLVHPDMRAAYEAKAWTLRLHIFAAIAALALGPFQFSPRLRARLPRLHRWMGRTYLSAGVAVGGVAGLYLAQGAFGGLVPRLGFSLLALAWLYTGWRAFAAIRGGDVAAHREWMVRNFALTLAAVTLRFYIPAFMAAGVRFEDAYPVIAWLCWVPNLALAQLWIARGRAQRRPRRAIAAEAAANAAPAQNVAAGPT